MSGPLLMVRDLVQEYAGGGLFSRGRSVRAVDGVSFEVGHGETLALVGESGSGKSSVARTILRLQPPMGGAVRFEDQDVFALDRDGLRRMRRRIQIVFQDPSTALNPRMKVGAAVAEGLDIHRLLSARERPGRVRELLEEVGLDPSLAERYPRELSGGQRQRVGIARALAVDPVLLVCDEPVSALDVSVQAQVLALLLDLQRRRGLSYLFIAHDLAVVRQIAHRIAVMYFGRILETGETEALLAGPRHPYTQALVAAVPEPDPAAPRTPSPVSGDPGEGRPAAGCPFQGRCPHPLKDARCRTEIPLLRATESTLVACHHVR